MPGEISKITIMTHQITLESIEEFIRSPQYVNLASTSGPIQKRLEIEVRGRGACFVVRIGKKLEVIKRGGTLAECVLIYNSH